MSYWRTTRLSHHSGNDGRWPLLPPLTRSFWSHQCILHHVIHVLHDTHWTKLGLLVRRLYICLLLQWGHAAWDRNRAFLMESWVSSGGRLSLSDAWYCQTFLHLWVPQFAQSGWWAATEISLSETSFSWLFTQIWLLQASSSGWGAAKEISCSETKYNWTFFQPWSPHPPPINDAQSKRSVSLKPVMTKTFADSDCPSLCLVNNEQPRNSASVIPDTAEPPSTFECPNFSPVDDEQPRNHSVEHHATGCSSWSDCSSFPAVDKEQSRKLAALKLYNSGSFPSRDCPNSSPTNDEQPNKSEQVKKKSLVCIVEYCSHSWQGTWS